LHLDRSQIKPCKRTRSHHLNLPIAIGTAHQENAGQQESDLAPRTRSSACPTSVLRSRMMTKTTATATRSRAVRARVHGCVGDDMFVVGNYERRQGQVKARGPDA